MVTPSTTVGGLFENVLKTVIKAVENRRDPSVRDLMRAALRVCVSESPDGTIEIDPQVD
jgi:predicted GNAT family N-acyltransferase